MRVIAYTRVSTELQVKYGGGLETQRVEIERWAAHNGHEIIAWYSDEGESGSNGLDTRVGLAQALVDLEDGGAEALIVDCMDRLARDLYLQETIVMRLRGVGVDVMSVKEPIIDGDPALRDFMRQILGAFAQYDRARIRGKMLAGARRKAAAGGYAWGRPPYGWRAEDGNLVAVAAQQRVIDRIRDLRKDGFSFRSIAEVLNDDGVPGPTGGRWHSEAVRRSAGERERMSA